MPQSDATLESTGKTKMRANFNVPKDDVLMIAGIRREASIVTNVSKITPHFKGSRTVCEMCHLYNIVRLFTKLVEPV